MRAHPIYNFLLVLIVITTSSITAAAAEHTQIQHLIDINPLTRRILHQPLFPSTSSSSPPPPQINSEPIFPTPDHPFFPRSPNCTNPRSTPTTNSTKWDTNFKKQLNSSSTNKPNQEICNCSFGWNCYSWNVICFGILHLQTQNKTPR